MAEKEVAHYDASYENFASDLYSKIRSDVFGQDIGQNGWQNSKEQDVFINWLDLNTSTRVLDVACGSGGPTLRIAHKTGSQALGIDLHEDGIKAAKEQAKNRGSSKRVRFDVMDASSRLAIEDETFDGLICVDAVNHLPERGKIFADWARVLKPGGRLVFTDPITITGPMTKEEIAIRSSIGFYLFVPAGIDEELLSAAGFNVQTVEDRTDNMAKMAERWVSTRQKYERDLRKVEGDETFEGQQIFFNVTALLARERRLSRYAFHAIRM